MASEQVFVELAPPALRGAVLCAIRRVLGGEPHAPVAGVVQANGYACLNVVAQGAVACGTGELPRRFLCGPMTAPLPSLATPPLASLSVVLQPWLLPPLFGVAPAALVDRLQDLGADSAPVQHWCELAQAAALGGELAPLWQALAGAVAGAGPAPELALESLLRDGPAAASAVLGITGRHYRRRFAAAMGLAPKPWLRIRRFEQALLALAGSSTPLGELAAAAGYADQAHMTREFGGIAQRAPGRLRAGLAQHEAGLWSLQPARVRFVQDAEDGAA